MHKIKMEVMLKLHEVCSWVASNKTATDLNCEAAEGGFGNVREDLSSTFCWKL